MEVFTVCRCEAERAGHLLTNRVPTLDCAHPLVLVVLPALACSARYASDLSAAEVKAALALLDDNKDGKIQLGEFVGWWVKEVQPAKA
jgi:hypothetical protein